MKGERMAVMSFDGATSMKAFEKLLKPSKRHLYHCFAHCKELIVKDACMVVQLVVFITQFMPVLKRHYRCLSKTFFEEIQNDFKNEMHSQTTA